MSVKLLAEEFGTPLYVYNSDVIIHNYTRLKKVLPQGTSLFYSMKANPLEQVCRILLESGAGIEVASEGELAIAISAGYSPENIVFSGPGKSESELRSAIKYGIKLINVDSLEEAKAINEIASGLDCLVPIGIRINPIMSFSNAKIQMTGVPSQFGIDEEIIDDAIEQIKKLQSLRVCGFQMYIGTQMLRSEDIVFNTEYALKLFTKLAEKHKIDLKIANVGGGFGVKYFEKENDLDLEKLEEGLDRLFYEYSAQLKQTEVIFESGRFILADAGQFITKVLYVKESKGMKYVICDGGSNCHSSAAFLGRFVRNNFPIHCFPDSVDREVATVVGPLCTPHDVLGQKVQVNRYIKPGDYVIIDKSGAYGKTYSPVDFLSHAHPHEVVISNHDLQ